MVVPLRQLPVNVQNHPAAAQPASLRSENTLENHERRMFNACLMMTERVGDPAFRDFMRMALDEIRSRLESGAIHSRQDSRVMISALNTIYVTSAMTRDLAASHTPAYQEASVARKSAAAMLRLLGARP
jgi:hypothetical protein